MKTLRIMSIIGLTLVSFSLLCLFEDWDSAVGWWEISSFYLVIFSIVVLIKSMRK